MKQIIFFCTALFCFSINTSAQDCATGFEFYKTGVTLEYTSYDKKDKVASVMTHRVSSVATKNDTLIANIEASATDDKGKDMYKSAFPIKCHDGTLYFDLRSMVPGTPTEQADMTVEVTGDDMMYPAGMKPGQNLPDSEMEMKMSMNGIKIMNMRYRMFNRKVEAEESVTTPAGTFKCLKMSYDMEYKLMGTRTTHSEYWFSDKVGMVKSISYDKKGNAESTMLLTKMSGK